MGGINGQTDGLVQALLGRMYYLMIYIPILFFGFGIRLCASHFFRIKTMRKLELE